MAQLFNQTIVVGSTPFVCPAKFTDDNGKAPLANASMREVAGTACIVTLYGPDGQTILNVAANGQRFRRDKRISYFTVSGNGATLVMDVSSGEWEDPDYLTAEVAGTVTVTDPAVESNTALIANAFALLPGGQIQKASNGGILTGST